MTDADKLKHDFLTCPLCLELFKEPKVLDCQHTYCLACLQQYLASQQTISSQCICPVCKEPTEIPTNDVRRLRNNFLVSGLVDFTTSQNQQNGNNNMPAELPGTQCPACEEPKDCEAFCRQCEMWLCASCTRSHGKLPATRDHAVMSLMDINTEGMVKLRQIDDVLTQLCEETDARYDAVLQQCQQVSDQVHKASTQINASAECVRAMVEEKREELLMQLTRLMSGVEDQLNQVLVEVEGRKSQIDQARAKVREARGSANAMLVMRTVQELQQNVRHLPPLRDVPAGLKSASGVQFHQGHSLLSSMQSDSLGDVTTLGQLSPLDATCFPKGRTPPSLQLQANLNAGFVSGIATYGAYGNAIFVTGCDKVYRLSTTDVGGPHAHLFAVDSRFWKKPWGVAVTTDNKVLVTDAGAGPSEGCVAVFGVDGKFMSYVATGLSMPRGIAASIMGQVFVCDQEDRCVYVFDAHKNFSLVKVLKRDAAGKYLFTSPLHVTVARNLDIVVSDSGNIIKTFTSTFQLKATYQSPFLDSEFWGVCTDPQGHVYVADWKYGIHVLSSTSNLEFGGLLKNRDAVRILEPSAVAFHSQTGQLLIGSSTAQIFTAKLY